MNWNIILLYLETDGQEHSASSFSFPFILTLPQSLIFSPLSSHSLTVPLSLISPFPFRSSEDFSHISDQHRRLGRHCQSILLWNVFSFLEPLLGLPHHTGMFCSDRNVVFCSNWSILFCSYRNALFWTLSPFHFYFFHSHVLHLQVYRASSLSIISHFNSCFSKHIVISRTYIAVCT